MPDDYSDIINLPHPTSRKHSRMSMAQRAAQFAPFAAVTGYGDCINESNRYVAARIELSEDEQADLNTKLRYLDDHASQHPDITVMYFVADKTKEGGSCVTARGQCKRIDHYNHTLLLADGTKISIDDLLVIEVKEDAYDD